MPFSVQPHDNPSAAPADHHPPPQPDHHPNDWLLKTTPKAPPWHDHAPGVDWTKPLTAGPLWLFFEDSARLYPGRPALNFLGRQWTYAQTALLVDQATKGFQGLGVGPGVQVGLCLPNTPYYSICYLAVLKAGGTVVNLNPLLIDHELDKQVRLTNCRVLVTLNLRQLLPRVDALGPDQVKHVVSCSMQDILPPLKGLLFTAFRRAEISIPAEDERHLDFAMLTANDGRYQPVEIDPATAIAVLQFTGGTTGTPKAAMLTHANLSANTEQIRRWFVGASPGQERILAVLPFFHVFAMTVIQNLGMALGAEMLLLPRFDLDQCLRTIAKARPTIMAGVPTLYNAMINHPEIEAYDFSSLRYCISGGAPLPAEVQQRFESLAGCRLVEGYGLTEAGPVTHCNPIKTRHPDDAVGRGIGLALPGTEAEFRSLLDPALPAEPGEPGELFLRGPQVMIGYWQNPAETAQVLQDGWLRTGDVGYADEDGFIHLIDRVKDLILVNGVNVYPRNVEEALYAHPDVAEAICLGVPDPLHGERPKCFVTLRDGAHCNADTLMDHMKKHLSRIAHPAAIEIRDSLPRTAVGKLSRKELLAEEKGTPHHH
jgi:long-chain acyl-CoA synthetase